MYPTYGIPFTDHTTAIFCMLSMYSVCLALKTNKTIYWFLIPIFLFLAFLTKQTPSGYFGILIFLVSIFYLLFNYQNKIIFTVFFGALISILPSVIYIYLKDNYKFITFSHGKNIGRMVNKKGELLLPFLLVSLGKLFQ